MDIVENFFPKARDFHHWKGAIRYRPQPGFWAAHYRCGLHSGFPKCCIRFYVRSWAMGSRETIRVHAARLVSSAARMGRWWGYIPCPDCCLNGLRADGHIGWEGLVKYLWRTLKLTTRDARALEDGYEGRYLSRADSPYHMVGRRLRRFHPHQDGFVGV